MGNCLDIPPPPPKRRPLHFSKPRYFVSSPTASIATGSIRSSAYTGYPPYAAYNGPRQTVTMGTIGDQMYSYPLGMANRGPGYLADPMLVNSSYAYYEDGEERESRHRRRHKRRERRMQNGGIPDRNANVNMKDANRNSTIITTFPDPDDDVIKRGHEIVVSISAPRSQNGVIATVTSGAIKTTTATTTRVMAAPSEAISNSDASGGITVNQQDVVVQSQVAAAPMATRGSTYITYIENEPPPPPSPEVTEQVVVEETTEVVEETTRVQRSQQEQEQEQQPVVEERQELEEQIVGFRETGEADAGIVQLFIDSQESERQQMTSRAESRTTYVSSGWLQRSGTGYSAIRSAPPDVALTYAAPDTQAMLAIKARLEAAGLKVAVSNLGFGDAEGNMTDWLMFPQAILDARMLIVLLSPESVGSPQVREEVSLAHLSDTSIFPVALTDSVWLLDAMDLNLKLQVACYQWTELTSKEALDIRVTSLVRSITEELEVYRSYEIIDEDYGEVSSWAQRRQKIIRQRQIQRYVDLGIHVTATQFWDITYGSEDSVPWERFYQDLRREYKEMLRSNVPIHSAPYMMDALRRDIGLNNEGRVDRTQFLEYCTDMGTDQDLWEKIRSVAREAQAIHDVFDVTSSVRAVAIENLAKFGNPNVLHAMRGLLKDRDPNIRALTCVSLSRVVWTGDAETLRALVDTLDDDNSLVREAGCQAMGRLKVKDAVPMLQLRCNDEAGLVREAAATALQDIGQSELDDVLQTIADASSEGEAREQEDFRF